MVGRRNNRAAGVALLAVLMVACGGGERTQADAARAIEASLAEGDLEAAADTLREAIARWPDDSRLRELQGDLDLERGYGTRAQAAYERAMRGAPRNRELQVKLARSLLAQNRAREALLIAEPRPDDPAEVTAGLDLVRLEAGLALGTVEFDAGRLTAENLWRLADASTAPAMVETRRRLEQLARHQRLIEAGREHARCRPADEIPPSRAARDGGVLRVGAGQPLATPAAAAAVARDGATVEIAAGDYDDGAVTWTQDDLLVRRVGAETPPTVRSAWIFRGGRATVEGFEFVGTPGVPAGIRAEGGTLEVRDAAFRSADLVAPDAPAREVLVSRSEFALGGRIDVGVIARLTVEFSQLAASGPAAPLLTRARASAIRYSRIADAAGEAGPLIDLPEGGAVEILGSELLRGSGAGAPDFVVFARGPDTAATLLVVGNTFFSDAAGRRAVGLRGDVRAIVANNVFGGFAATVSREAIQAGNFAVNDGLVDPRGGDFRLTPGSPAIDAAVDVAGLQAGARAPEYEYRHPASGTERRAVWEPDAGAHEYCVAPVLDLPLPVE